MSWAKAATWFRRSAMARGCERCTRRDAGDPDTSGPHAADRQRRSGPSDPSRTATGHLTEASGAPTHRNQSAVTDSPVTGVYAQYQLAGQPPVGATQAVVGFRVNTDDPATTYPSYWFAGPADSSFSLYQASYIQPADGIERLPNGDFSAGAQSWIPAGQTQLIASNRGAGQMMQVTATASQFATLDSQQFGITPGAPFQVSFFANIPPSLVASGYFTLAFTNGTMGNYLDIPGTSAPAPCTRRHCR